MRRALRAGLCSLVGPILIAAPQAAWSAAQCEVSVKPARAWVEEHYQGPQNNCDFNTILMTKIVFDIEAGAADEARTATFRYNLTVDVVKKLEQGGSERREAQESRELAVRLDPGNARVKQLEEIFGACKYGWRHVTDTEHSTAEIEIKELVVDAPRCEIQVR